MKRIFDIICSAVGLALLSPILLYIAWRIHHKDGGPVFYRGVRSGLHGKSFKIFKFRSMVINADQLGGPSTPDNDPRITAIGCQLRKYKLDELPQLINVLLGEMSLVGPRPEVEVYTNMFTAEEKEILSVPPGITDWASIWNPHQEETLEGAEDPEKVYMEIIRPTKLKLQLKYARNHSFLADLKILFLTLFALFRPQSPTILELRRRLES